jgi:endonuclease/exonuclease/phosphatase family metal-dependent hydrolase
MQHKPISVILSVSFVLVSCARCTLNGLFSQPSVTIMSYNVENLFDDIDDGTEYRDYDPGEGGWNTALYHAKLKNVAEAIRAAGKDGVDICLLQEIENEKVVTDLLEGYLNVMKYTFAFAAPRNGTATTITVLSRFKPEYLLVHSVQVDPGVPLRPILETGFDIRGEGLVLLNNHWKSKSGGAWETEVHRRAAAAFIRGRIESLRRDRPDLCVIVAGDLNEGIDEESADGGEYQTALRKVGDDESGSEGKFLGITASWDKAVSGPLRLFSPWFESSHRGSYVYAGRWEKIDHFLIAPAPDGSGFDFSGFEVVEEDFLLNVDGFPRRWSNRSADGYSDHLPILLQLKK